MLDAAARHLSFTRAADELAVTPAAVGQQIRALEDTRGVVLFRRTPKGLELTPEGEAGLGRATVPEMLAAPDLAAGRVVRVGEAQPSRHGYWLVAPTPQWRQKKVQALVEALGD